MNLLVRIIDNRLSELYTARFNHKSDCGMDLYIRTTEDSDHIIVPANARSFKIYTGVQCALSNGAHGYYLYPRSSIVKTPLRLANSLGIIDPEYRGEIIAVVDNLSNEDVVLTRDRSLFQICMPTLYPFETSLVETLDSTTRGEGGFGSTH